MFGRFVTEPSTNSGLPPVPLSSPSMPLRPLMSCPFRAYFVVSLQKENLWNTENEAVNFPIQSTASDLTLLSAIQLHHSIRDIAKILILVHDSILFELPKENVKLVVAPILHTMQTLPGKYLKTDMPFIADIEIGTNWGNLEKYKEGKE